MTFAPGQSVRTRLQATPGYLRLPVYARGRTGVVDSQHGPETYSVRFRARDLWGEQAGDHEVFLELLESYLEPA
ncbi:MAG: SH3-like domain-containing protein [Labedaea sp.]